MCPGLSNHVERRHDSKESLQFVQTAKRRGFRSLVAQWDKDPDWTNSMLKVGWTRDDMLHAMDIYATPGKDPKDYPFDKSIRQERAGNTKALRFQKDKETESLNTPCAKISPLYHETVIAANRGEEAAWTTYLTPHRSAGAALRKANQDRAKEREEK